MLLLSLPGFRRGADRIRGLLDAGIHVLVVRGHSENQRVAEQLLSVAGGTDQVSVFEPIEPAITLSELAREVYERFTGQPSKPGAGVDTLVRNRVGAWQVFCAEVPAGYESTAWIDFLWAYAERARGVDVSERSTFLFSVPIDAGMDQRVREGHAAISVNLWSNMLDENDAITYAFHTVANESTGGPLWRSLKANVIAALAGIDFDFIDYLAHLAIEDFDDFSTMTRGFLSSHPNRKTRQLQRGEATVTRGEYRNPYGQWETPLIDCLPDDRNGRELSSRLWRAQVAVLYPFLESQRRDMIDAYRTQLSVPHIRASGERVTDLDNLDLGDIVRQVDMRLLSLSQRQSTRLRFLRDLRNELAHFRPFSFRGLSANRSWFEIQGPGCRTEI